jgi:hypothetical protein
MVLRLTPTRNREGRIAWGINTEKEGINILRGIRRPDGDDEAES